MQIPSNNRWTQLNQGDVFGALASTRNMNFETPSKARLARKSIALFNPSLPEANDLSYSQNIVYFNDTYISIHSDGLRTFDLEGAAVGSIASDPAPSIYGDGQVFNNKLYVTTSNNLSSWTGSTWANSLKSLTANVPHPMTLFDSLPTYKLAIGNGNKVETLDTSNNANATVLTLPTQYIITSLAYRNGYLYIGTRNQNGGDTKLYIWDGNTANANYEVPVSGNWIYSVKPYRNSVAAVTSSGEVFYVNGTTAERIAAFPVADMPSVTWQSNLTSDLGRIFHRGMITDGDTIYFNVSALVDQGLQQDYLPGFESGVWVFHPQVGLYHMASANFDVYRRDSGLSVTDSVITTSAAHKLKTGDSVVFSGVSGLSGTETYQIYYVSVQSTTTIKLAKSRRALKDEQFITITGTADSGDILVYSPNVDYFQYGRVTSGAIAFPTAYDSFFKNWNTPIIWSSGAQDTDLQEQSYAMHILTDSFNVGHIETQRIYSRNIEETWKGLYTFFDDFDLSNERAIVKFRTSQELGYPTDALLGTWLDTKTINLDIEDASFIKEGDEMMIVDGTGRGYSAHVTEVSSSTTVVSVTVDEEFGVATDAARVVFTNYQKSSVHSIDDETKDYTLAMIDKKAPWVQVKIELRGFQPSVSKLEASAIPHKSSR